MSEGPVGLHIERYEHGGVRLWFERPGGGRDLVADLYEPEERSAKLIDAIVAVLWMIEK